MGSVLQDVRYAVRTLLRMPGFALTAIVTLALGIGANTVIFSVVDAVLLRPLPFSDANQLVVVWERNFSRNRDKNVSGPANFIRWREQNRVFEGMAGGIAFPMNLTGGPEPERVNAGIVSPNLFSLLGVNAVLGRTFTPDEEQPGKDNVVMLNRGYWQRRFGGDRNVIGRVLQLNGQNVTVVGVAPDRVNFPEAVEIWTPLTIRPASRNARGRFMTVVARMKPGVTLAQAQAEMDLISSRTRAELPAFDTGWDVNVVSIGEQYVGDVRRALLVLLGAVVFVLLIACVNVANLLLARATSREREIAVRLALGASRSRIVRQLLTESILLSAIGAGAGLLIAYWSMAPMLATLPKEVPTFRPITLNAEVLVFNLVIAILAAIAFGLAPALRSTDRDPQHGLREGGRGSTAGRAHHRLRNGLVIAETAFALVLLACAGVLLRSFVKLLHVDPGFRPQNVLTMQVAPTSPRYEKDEAVAQYFQEAVRRVRGVPGVMSAAVGSWLPLDGLGSATMFTLDDRPKPAAGEEPVGDVRAVTEDYFATMGISMLRGRDFNSSDRAPRDVKKVIINRAMAEQFWPGQDPIGKRLTMPWGKDLHAEVVAVVADVNLVSLNAPARSTLYWYLPQFPYGVMSFVVRTTGDPMARMADVRQRILSVDPDQPVAKIRTMQSVLDASVTQSRFTMALLGGFAALALILAVIGIYGVISYSVTQRTNEMGVRLALGAQRGDILRLVIASGMKMTLAGIGIGTVAALAITRLLTTLLFETTPADPVAFTAVAATLLVASLLASSIPARRAARLDPMNALRYE